MIEFNATFLIAMLSFVVFIMIMNAIFYNPILGIIRKRDEYIASNYEEAKRLSDSAKEYNDTHSAKIEQTQKKCRHDIRTVVAQVQEQAAAKLIAAKENNKNLIQKKKEVLYSEGEALKNTVKNTVVKDLASSIASKLTGVDTTIDNIEYDQVNKVMD